MMNFSGLYCYLNKTLSIHNPYTLCGAFDHTLQFSSADEVCSIVMGVFMFKLSVILSKIFCLCWLKS